MTKVTLLCAQMLALCAHTGPAGPKIGYAIPPGCQPGYWVRLATGEALFMEGEEVRELVNPREPPRLHACCICADMKDWKYRNDTAVDFF